MISRDELWMMLNEFWVADANEACVKASVIFLRRNGFSSEEIDCILGNVGVSGICITKKDENYYQEKLEELEDYKMWKGL